MKYHHPIQSNDFVPRTPFADEWFEIMQTKCIHCHKKYDDKEIIFATLSNRELIWWHSTIRQGDCHNF